MTRKLRVAFSVVCGTIGLLLVSLWVRSYFSSVFVVGHFFYRGALIAESSHGRVTLGYRHGALLSNGVSGSHWGIHYKSLDEWQPFDPPMSARPAFGLSKSQAFDFVILPYWFFTLGSVIAIAGLWSFTRRFSLRSLLIATTLIAVILGLAVLAKS
jgi:hypothetical protein